MIENGFYVGTCIFRDNFNVSVKLIGKSTGTTTIQLKDSIDRFGPNITEWYYNSVARYKESIMRCRGNSPLNITNANGLDIDRFYLYMRAPRERSAIELGRDRDKSHQFTTDRYTERAFIKIEVAIFLLQSTSWLSISRYRRIDNNVIICITC